MVQQAKDPALSLQCDVGLIPGLGFSNVTGMAKTEREREEKGDQFNHRDELFFKLSNEQSRKVSD